MRILELFCAVDEFWVQFAPAWHQHLVLTGR
jgi:hypothetical protein